MPSSSRHFYYSKAKKKWDLVRDVIDNDAKKHLPLIDVNDLIRSQNYRDAGVLTNVTALTLTGLLHLVFRKPAEINIPKEIEYIEEDATGDGSNITQLAHKIVSDMLKTGRGGCLVDYPRVDPTLDSSEKQDDRARIKFYPAETIINWQVKQIGSKVMLVKVVLEEFRDEINELDGFDWVTKVYRRHLYLDKRGIYHQELFDENDEVVEPAFPPTKANGEYFREIPFQFFGSENNNVEIDSIPLYDIANLNFAHYRNSCDLEESIFLCGQPTTFIHTSANTDEVSLKYPGGIKFGASYVYTFPADTTENMLQAAPNPLVMQAMKEKREELVAIGARLIQPAGGRETAEAADLRFGGQNSILSTVTMNASLGIKILIKWLCEFQIKQPKLDKIVFKLNDHFYDKGIDPQTLVAMMQGANIVFSIDEIRDYARTNGGMNLDKNLPMVQMPSQPAVQAALGAPVEQNNNPEGNEDDRPRTEQ